MVPGLGCSPPFPHRFRNTGHVRTGLCARVCTIRDAVRIIRFPFTRFIHAPVSLQRLPRFQRAANRSVEHQLGRRKPATTGIIRATLHHSLSHVDSCLYQFVRTGKLDVTEGHHDAGDYSKYTINSAALIHYLVFATDNFSGRRGSGQSRAFPRAETAVTFCRRLSGRPIFSRRCRTTTVDSTSWFIQRDVRTNTMCCPNMATRRLCFPKTTSVTVAATAALAQIGSSPRFPRSVPARFQRYSTQALKGWAFLATVPGPGMAWTALTRR